MDADLYQHLAARARGCCEACGVSVMQSREVDHFFGRAKAEEVEATCWVLCPRCHYAKTQNSPSARHWLDLFIKHCTRWNYIEARTRAEARRDFVNARTKLLDDTKARTT